MKPLELLIVLSVENMQICGTNHVKKKIRMDYFTNKLFEIIFNSKHEEVYGLFSCRIPNNA